MQVTEPRKLAAPLMREKSVWLITCALAVISSGHYLLSTDYAILHNILQRLYYVPVTWAAYKYGRNGGLAVSSISGLLYLPHILLEWQGHPEYRTSLLIELALFIIVGAAAGVLFEQKAASQRALLSYEKMAIFGNLSRTIIRSLKIPLRSIRGMLLTLEPASKSHQSVAFCIQTIDEEIATIERVREDLMALVRREKLRLKKRNLNEVMFQFVSQVETSLDFRGIRITKQAKNIRLDAHVNQTALVNTLHTLFDSMLDHGRDVTEMTIYTDESGANVWLGASVNGVYLHPQNQSALGAQNTQNHREYELISVINTMNSHFGDIRFRWCEARLVEFALIFPKKLKLPRHLKDEPLDSGNSGAPRGQAPSKHNTDMIKEEV